MKKKKLSNIAFYLTIMLVISKCLGIIRDSFLAYKFGTSYVVDVYTVSIIFSNIAFSLFSVGFSEAYVALYSRINDKEKKVFFNNTVTIVFLGACIIASICFIFSNILATLFAPGFDGDVKILLVIFVKIMSVVIPIQAVFSIYLADETVRENFLIAKFCDFIVINILVIFTICIASNKNPYFLPIGYVIANLVAFIILAFYSCKKKHVQYSFLLRFKEDSFVRLLFLAIPLGVSFLINDLNTMSDGIFASTLGEGMTSALNYANKMQSLFLAVTVNIISVVCFPRVSQSFASGQRGKALYYLKKSMLIAIYLAIPFAVMLFFFSSNIIEIVFKRGHFGSESAEITSIYLKYYCVGIPFYAMCNVGNNALAANERQKQIMINTAISVAVNIGLDMILIKIIGYRGLPVATSLAGIVQFFIVSISLKREKIFIFHREEIIELLKILISVIVTSLLLIFTNRIYVRTDTFIISMIKINGFIITYALFTILCNTKIIRWMFYSLFSLRING